MSSSSLVEKIKYKGYKIEIHQDTDAENPYIDYDQTTDLVTWHRNYNFNSTRRRVNNYGKFHWEGYAPYDSPQEVLDAVDRGELVWAAPLYAYEHGGITVNLGSMDYRWPDQQWDCGLLGMVYVTKEKAKAEWPNYGGMVLQHCCWKRAESEIETFDQYLTGQVYGMVITHKKQEVDSCWGFYGFDYCVQEAKSVVDNDIEYQARAHEKVLDEWFGFIPQEVFYGNATTASV